MAEDMPNSLRAPDESRAAGRRHDTVMRSDASDVPTSLWDESAAMMPGSLRHGAGFFA
jgi:hypothetical protein